MQQVACVSSLTFTHLLFYVRSFNQKGLLSLEVNAELIREEEFRITNLTRLTSYFIHCKSSCRDCFTTQTGLRLETLKEEVCVVDVVCLWVCSSVQWRSNIKHRQFCTLTHAVWCLPKWKSSTI